MDAPLAALVDAHVHFHSCFDARTFLDGANRNFAAAAAAAGYGDRYAAFLLLTETASAHWFDDLQRVAENGTAIAPGWRATATGDPRQLALVGPEGATLNVVSGYQIITAEKLEVLALGCRTRIADGNALDNVVSAVRASDALPVVPWGFGKWLGRRGQHVQALIKKTAPDELFLGENSNRITAFGDPPIFREARNAGIRILPGTDPLPFPREAARTGSVGFIVESEGDESARLWSAVRRNIELQTSIRSYGRLETPWCFARNQIWMQVHKRFGTAA
jgi:hypothetical protein